MFSNYFCDFFVKKMKEKLVLTVYCLSSWKFCDENKSGDTSIKGQDQEA